MATIELDTFLPHPPSRVWRALTDRELLGRWLMPNDFEPRVGHRFAFEQPPPFNDQRVECEVLDLRPEEVLAFSWCGRRGRGPVLDTTVTWRLVAEGRGTRLFLTHAGFDDRDPLQQQISDIMGGGWKSDVLPALEQVLADLPRA